VRPRLCTLISRRAMRSIRSQILLSRGSWLITGQRFQSGKAWADSLNGLGRGVVS